jgi:hypothetical protein
VSPYIELGHAIDIPVCPTHRTPITFEHFGIKPKFRWCSAENDLRHYWSSCRTRSTTWNGSETIRPENPLGISSTRPGRFHRLGLSAPSGYACAATRRATWFNSTGNDRSARSRAGTRRALTVSAPALEPTMGAATPAVGGMKLTRPSRSLGVFSAMQYDSCAAKVWPLHVRPRN